MVIMFADIQQASVVFQVLTGSSNFGLFLTLKFPDYKKSFTNLLFPNSVSRDESLLRKFSISNFQYFPVCRGKKSFFLYNVKHVW